MFKARTTRTLLTILGMGVGMAAILFLVALGYGIQREMLKTITTADSLLSLDVYPVKVGDYINLETIEKIKLKEEVAHISPVFSTKIQAKYENVVSDAQAEIVDDQFLNLNGTKITDGKGITGENKNGVVISSTFAKLFNKNPVDMIGGELTFSMASPENKSDSKKGKVVNIEKIFTIIGVVDSKENSLYINKEGISEAVNIFEFSQLKIKCRTAEVLEKVKSDVTEMGFYVSAVSDMVKQTDKFFAMVRIVLGFFGMIALIVSSIGMFNTMTVALLERTEEIGIMKAIGAYNKDILAMFVFESTVMGFLGGVCGVILGILGAETFNFLLNIVAKRMGGSAISIFYFPVWFLGFIVLSSTFVGFLTGIIPARKASSTDPLDALRYK
ncbi:MAG TPA: ABC transporter permease [Candidatus Moranbacteria bacterium]|nr:ABC transporter permease [Candidatus Moranbacteria bacterium]